MPTTHRLWTPLAIRRHMSTTARRAHRIITSKTVSTDNERLPLQVSFGEVVMSYETLLFITLMLITVSAQFI